MERVSHFILEKSDSVSSYMSGKSEIALPVSTKPQARFRVRAVLGHCLYRRVVIWTIVVIFLLSVTLFNPRIGTRPRDVLDLVHLGQGTSSDASLRKQPSDQTSLQKQDGDNENKVNPSNSEKTEDNQDQQNEQGEEQQKSDMPHWLSYNQ